MKPIYVKINEVDVLLSEETIAKCILYKNFCSFGSEFLLTNDVNCKLESQFEDEVLDSLSLDINFHFEKEMNSIEELHDETLNCWNLEKSEIIDNIFDVI